MDDAPTVSAILRVYNGEEYLQETLDAILDQTFGDFEVVAMDDGSTDATPAILDAVDDERFRVFHVDHQGHYRTFNEAVRRARGRYIAVVDHDDPPFPERFAKQVAHLEDHPDVGALGTAAVFEDVETGEKEVKAYATDPKELRRVIRYYNPMIFPSVMMRREALDRVGLLDVDRLGPDHHLFIRMAKHYDLANLEEPLVLRRLHPGQYSERTHEDRLPTMAEHRLMAVRELDPTLEGYLYAYLFKAYTLLPRAVRERLPQGLLRGVHGLFDRTVERREVSK